MCLVVWMIVGWSEHYCLMLTVRYRFQLPVFVTLFICNFVSKVMGKWLQL